MPTSRTSPWRRSFVLTAAIAFMVLTALVPAGAIVVQREPRLVTGYPRCTRAEEPNGWIWREGRRFLGITPDRFLVHDGTTFTASGSSCAGAAACLAHAPHRSGTLATIVGSASAERIAGTAGRDLIVGGGGDDVLDGRGGQDLVCAGDGDDVVRGGGQADLLLGEGGRDVIFAGRGADRVHGGDGLDVLYGQGGDDALFGGVGEDGCFGGPGTDELTECRVANQAGAVYGAAPHREFEVVVEEGLAVASDQIVAEVDRILADDRSWIGGGNVGFRRVRGGGAFTIIVASPATVDKLCYPLRTGGYLSCRNGNKVILNVDRWTGATDWWPTTIEVYREYLVNHEVGHLLGHGHVSCPGSGRLAPVMMQQTKGLDGCIANGWVYPGG